MNCVIVVAVATIVYAYVNERLDLWTKRQNREITAECNREQYCVANNERRIEAPSIKIRSDKAVRYKPVGLAYSENTREKAMTGAGELRRCKMSISVSDPKINVYHDRALFGAR